LGLRKQALILDSANLNLLAPQHAGDQNGRQRHYQQRADNGRAALSCTLSCTSLAALSASLRPMLRQATRAIDRG
jgi:hypothetical protein